jgi:hypothetical protein
MWGGESIPSAVACFRCFSIRDRRKKSAAIFPQGSLFTKGQFENAEDG